MERGRSGHLGGRLGLPLWLLLAWGLTPRAAGATEPHLRHQVQPGQTLWSIAHGYGVDVEELMSLNGIRDPTDLPAGSTLRVPRLRGHVMPPDPDRENPRPTFAWPVEGRLTSLYGRRRRSLHSGIDLATTRGTIVVAAAEGSVVRAGARWGRYGEVVLIRHRSGYSSLYAHLSRSFVKPGELVRQGQAIGAVGSTGNATGPHLHFEIWAGDRTLDPLGELHGDGKPGGPLRAAR